MLSSLNYSSPAQQVSEVWSRDQKEMEPKKNGKTEVPQSRRNTMLESEHNNLQKEDVMKQNFQTSAQKKSQKSARNKKLALVGLSAAMIFVLAMIFISCEKDCDETDPTSDCYVQPPIQKHNVEFKIPNYPECDGLGTCYGGEYINPQSEFQEIKDSLNKENVDKVIIRNPTPQALLFASTVKNRQIISEVDPLFKIPGVVAYDKDTIYLKPTLPASLVDSVRQWGFVTVIKTL